MSLIPVVGQKPKAFGKIESVALVESEYGVVIDGKKQQIEILLHPADPGATTMRKWWFKPSDRANSKWIGFVESFNTARKKVVPDTKSIKDEQEMVGSFVRIEETTKSGVIQGEQKEWNIQEVVEYYPTEADCVNAWRDAQPKTAEPEAIPWDNPTPAAPATPTATAIPAPIVAVLKAQWATAGGDVEKFWTSVSSWGYAKDAVLAAVK